MIHEFLKKKGKAGGQEDSKGERKEEKERERTRRKEGKGIDM